MKLIIEVDPTVGTAKVLSSLPGEREATNQPPFSPTITQTALDAGAFPGMIRTEKTIGTSREAASSTFQPGIVESLPMLTFGKTL